MTDTQASEGRFSSHNILAAAAGGVAVALALFHFYTSVAGVLPASNQRAVHLGGILALCFLGIAARRGRGLPRRAIDILLAIGGVASCIYIVVSFDQLLARAGRPNTTDIVFGVILIVVVLEATRRSVGWAMPILAVIALVFAYFGPYMPELIAHRGASVGRIIGFVYLGNEGIFGLPLGVAATYVMMFLIFGTFLTMTGAGEILLQLSCAAVGRWTGGAAKAAVVASGAVGSITGVATANVVVTGSVTIPLMQRAGYRPAFAAAVEAAASTGGQIMPPIMGAAAFVIAEFLRIPYREIVLAAIAPAFLYFWAIFIAAHFEAKRMKIPGVFDTLPLRDLLLGSYLFFIPMTVLIVLIALQYSPMRAAFWSIAVMLALKLFDRVSPLQWRKIYDALVTAGNAAISIGAACATAGIIIALINVTGLGLRLSSLIIHLAGNSMIALLGMTMVACLLLGLGLPTVGAYISAAILAAPALVEMGVHPIAAHFFVFFFAIMANITPPVCIAAYTAAGIAGADPIRTGFVAVKLALAGIIIAYGFVYEPVLLMVDAEWSTFTLAATSAAIGVTSLAAAVVGYGLAPMPIWQRLLSGIGACLMMFPGWQSDTAGGLAILLVLLVQIRAWRQQRAGQPEASTGSVTAPQEPLGLQQAERP